MKYIKNDTRNDTNIKIPLQEMRIPIFGYIDINDRLQLIYDELEELKDALKFIIELESCPKKFLDNYEYDKDKKIYSSLELSYEFAEKLFRRYDEAKELLDKFKNNVRIVSDTKDKRESNFEYFLKQYNLDKKKINNEQNLKSLYLCYFFRQNEKIYEIIREILDLQQLLNNAEAQNVDVLPDQFILPPRTHYRRTFKIVEINNQIRYFYAEAIFNIINKGIYKKEVLNQENLRKTNLISFSHRLVSNFYKLKLRNSNEGSNEEYFIVNSPFWFLASPRYLPILAHEIAHACLPLDIFQHPEHLKEEIIEPLEKCTIEINNLYSIDKQIINSQPNKPVDDVIEMFSDILALLVAGPYYIYSLFNSYLGKTYNLEEMINFKIFNVLIRLEVLLNIIKQNFIEFENGKSQDLLFDQLVIDDLKEMSKVIKLYKRIFEEKLKIFRNKAKENFEYYYILHEKTVQIMTFYFNHITAKIIKNKEIENYLFLYQEFNKKTPEENFNILIHSIYLFSVIKRLAFFQDHTNKKIENGEIEKYLKITSYNLLEEKKTLEKFFKNKHYISQNAIQNLTHLIWMSTLLQNKIDTKKIGNKLINEIITKKKLKNNDKILNNINNNLLMVENSKTNYYNFLNYNYIEVPFLKVIYQYYKILNYININNYLKKDKNFKKIKDLNINKKIIKLPKNFNKIYKNKINKFYKNYHLINLYYLISLNNNFNNDINKTIEDYKNLININLIHRGLKLFYFNEYYLNFKKNENLLNILLNKNNNEEYSEKYLVIGHFDLLVIEKLKFARKKFKKNINLFDKNEIKKYFITIENEEIFYYDNENIEKNFNNYINYDIDKEKNSSFLALSSIRFTRLPDQISLYLEGDINIKYLIYKVKKYNETNKDKKIGIKAIYKSTSWHDIYIIWEFKSLIHFKYFFSKFLAFPQKNGEKNNEYYKFISNSITYFLYKQETKNNINEKEIDNFINLLNDEFNKNKNKNKNNKIILISYGKIKHNIFIFNNYKKRNFKYKKCDFIKINNTFGRHDIKIKWILFLNKKNEKKFIYFYLYILKEIGSQYNVYHFETTFLSD